MVEVVKAWSTMWRFEESNGARERVGERFGDRFGEIVPTTRVFNGLALLIGEAARRTEFAAVLATECIQDFAHRNVYSSGGDTIVRPEPFAEHRRKWWLGYDCRG